MVMPVLAYRTSVAVSGFTCPRSRTKPPQSPARCAGRWWGPARRRIEVAGRQPVEIDRRVLDGPGSASGDVVIAQGRPDGALEVDAEGARPSDDVPPDIKRLWAEKDGARHLTR